MPFFGSCAVAAPLENVCYHLASIYGRKVPLADIVGDNVPNEMMENKN